jgi:transcriptional regulator with XRE-family HTH domain
MLSCGASMAGKLCFRDRLMALLSELNLSQNEFARQLGSTSAFVSNMARGKSKPGLEFLQKIATTFGVSLDWLVLGRGNMRGEPRLHSEWYQSVVLLHALAELVAAGNADAQMLAQELLNDLPISQAVNPSHQTVLGELQTKIASSALIAELYNGQLHEPDSLRRNKQVLRAALEPVTIIQQGASG